MPRFATVVRGAGVRAAAFAGFAARGAGLVRVALARVLGNAAAFAGATFFNGAAFVTTGFIGVTTFAAAFRATFGAGFRVTFGATLAAAAVALRAAGFGFAGAAGMAFRGAFAAGLITGLATLAATFDFDAAALAGTGAGRFGLGTAGCGVATDLDLATRPPRLLLVVP